MSRDLNPRNLTPELTQLTMTGFPNAMCYRYSSEVEKYCLGSSHSDSYSDTGSTLSEEKRSCVFQLVF